MKFCELNFHVYFLSVGHFATNMINFLTHFTSKNMYIACICMYKIQKLSLIAHVDIFLGYKRF